MNLSEIMTAAGDAVAVKRVFGEPYEKDGITIIPAVNMGGGAGFGGGHDEERKSGGEGGGFGLGSRPVGAYVIKDGNVTWRPAYDVTKIVSSLSAVAIAYLITRSRIQRARLKHSA